MSEKNKTGVTIDTATTVKLNINGKEQEITLEEARVIWADLNRHFGKQPPKDELAEMRKLIEKYRRDSEKERDIFPTVPRPSWPRPMDGPGNPFYPDEHPWKLPNVICNASELDRDILHL